MMKQKETAKIKIILIDVDGTLFDNQNQKVWPSTIQALKRAKEKDIKVVIATGRARFMLDSIQEAIPYVDFFVLINGQVIEDNNNNVLYHNPIPTSNIEKIIKDFSKHGAAYGFEGRTAKAVNTINDYVLTSFGGLAIKVPPINPTFYLDNLVYQMWGFCPKNIIDAIQTNHPEFQFLKWMDIGYDILPRNASKKEGMIAISNMLGIPIKNIMAIGDAINDFEMVRYAGVGIAMGNACEEVKSVADFVTSNVDEDGIYLALTHYQII